MPALLPGHVMRQDVIDHLRANNIQTTIHYPPVHLMSFYREIHPTLHLPRTENFAQRELTLPLHPRMDSEDVEAVVSTLAGAVHSCTSVEVVA
jgi:dTDP-4-amino-4,6-dideoxygalactose transaminase